MRSTARANASDWTSARVDYFNSEIHNDSAILHPPSYEDDPYRARVPRWNEARRDLRRYETQHAPAPRARGACNGLLQGHAHHDRRLGDDADDRNRRAP